MSRPKSDDFDLDRYLWRQGFLSTDTVFFRRRLIEQAGLLDETLNCSMDIDFHTRLACWHHCTSQKVRAPIVKFRLHPQSKSVGEGKNWSETVVIQTKIAEAPFPLSTRALVWGRLARHYFYSGDTTRARRYLLRGLKAGPPRWAIKTMVIMLVESLLGWRTYTMLRSARDRVWRVRTRSADVISEAD